jgi:hypothetical protein
MLIIWSDQAIDDVSANIEYLEAKWSFAVVENFKHKFDQVLIQLQSSEVVFQSTGKKFVYQIVVVKQITLYYELKDNKINLLRF